MANIKPFRGLIYNPERFNTLSNVLAPPYDVVSQSQRVKLLAKSPYNIINLTLGERSDNGDINPEFYSKAKSLWDSWRSDAIIKRVDKPGIWIMKESFTSLDGSSLSRHGFFALIKLEDYSKTGIQGHERTLSRPKKDRFKLMESTKVNFSPIFFIYSDSDNQINSILLETLDGSMKSTIDLNGSVEVESIQITKPDIINKIIRIMLNKSVLIADGHHRYETANSFHHQYNSNPSLSTEYVMGYFVSTGSEGLKIFPTHRGLHNIEQFDVPAFLSKCQDYFAINGPGEGANSNHANLPGFKVTFGNNMDYYFLLKPEVFDMLSIRLKPSQLASFDVAILEEIIFKRILGLTQELINNQKNLKYYHMEEECYLHLQSKEIQCAFIVHPVNPDKLIDLGKYGGILPQKSTYFYPKTPVGIVTNSLEI